MFVRATAFTSTLSRRTIVSLVALVVTWLGLPHSVCASPGESPKRSRPGKASSLIGWSVAVADLDSDGHPDLAIAKGAGYAPEGYLYRLELNLSQEESQVLHFSSPHSALSISVQDLDDDEDLDIVLTRTFDGGVEEVWINNGRGEFQRGNAADFVGVVQDPRRQSVLDPGLAPANDLSVSLRRWVPPAARLIQVDYLPVPLACNVEQLSYRLMSNASHSTAGTRGPP